MKYIIKMLRIDSIIEDKTILITDDFEKAINAIETNENNIQDNYYDCGVIISVKNNKICDIMIYDYDLSRNEFCPISFEYDYIYKQIKNYYIK